MRLMIVGHLDGFISAAGKIALQRGAKVIHCEDTEQALGALRNGKGADVAMVDIKQKIAAFVEALAAERIHIPVIACGVNVDARAAVKAIQDGAKEYVPLPPDADLIAAILQAVTEENNTMIAGDPAMQAVIKTADKVAPSEATILITGESGTGKEVMSSYIHQKSKRRGAAFIAVNCAAIPENLLESELFGHEKGAFTGALKQKLGRVEEADGGTIFLDEIADMGKPLQAKLLRFLEDGTFTRVGGTQELRVNVRLVAATNRDIVEAIAAGEFREDLFHRLNVVQFHLPPLRERGDDVRLLVEHFLKIFRAVLKKNVTGFTPAAQQKLLAHRWPGNVRELRNVVERALILETGREVSPASLPDFAVEARLQKTGPAALAPDESLEAALERIERELIHGALEQNSFSLTRAAAQLKLTRHSLRYRMQRLNMKTDAGDTD